MADDKTKIGKPERDLVSISEDYEVRDLTDHFDISPTQAKR
jgi:hypothetical protein